MTLKGLITTLPEGKQNKQNREKYILQWKDRSQITWSRNPRIYSLNPERKEDVVCVYHKVSIE